MKTNYRRKENVLYKPQVREKDMKVIVAMAGERK